MMDLKMSFTAVFIACKELVFAMREFKRLTSLFSLIDHPILQFHSYLKSTRMCAIVMRSGGCAGDAPFSSFRGSLPSIIACTYLTIDSLVVTSTYSVPLYTSGIDTHS